MTRIPLRSARRFLPLVAAGLLCACAVEGQGERSASLGTAEFAALDINEDGWLSGNEIDACACAERDADEDGRVTPEELLGTAAAAGAAPENGAAPADAAPAPASPVAAATASGGSTSGDGALPAAGAPPVGSYECYYFGADYALWNSSMVSMRIHSATEYEAMEERGRFRYDPAAKRVRMESGPLAGREADMKESSGKPAIVFDRQEAEAAGLEPLDISDTWCYFEP